MKLYPPSRNEIITSVVFLAILIASTWLYWPGVSCCFMLDDNVNLHYLTFLNQDPTWKKLFLISLDGISSELGRPVSLLSFAAQHHSWPDSPAHFKYVNLLIHLFNGVLVFAFCRQLLATTNSITINKTWAALAVMAIWLLHPMQVSTVLYVIQRMAQLSCLFTLASLICYLKGRYLYADGNKKAGAILMTAGYGILGIIAILSKENAILLPLYVLVIEASFLRDLNRDRFWKIWAWIFIYIPLTLLALYIISRFNLFLNDFAIRESSMIERLMTETRVLLNYLGKIFITQPGNYSLYHDDYVGSTGLLTPRSTLWSIIGILLIGTLAYMTRNARQLSFLLFGILWFFTAHLLESTIFPLETYYEHRNYVAIIGPVLILVLGVPHLLMTFRALSLVKGALIAVSAVWIIAAVAVTRSETTLWGKPLKQTMVWSKEKPASKRAQMAAIPIYASYKQFDQIDRALKNVFKYSGDESSVYLVLYRARCKGLIIRFPSTINVFKKLKSAKSSAATISALGNIMMNLEKGECPHIKTWEYAKLLDSLLANKRFKHYYGGLHFLYARHYIRLKDAQSALKHLETSYQLSPSTRTRLYQIQTLSYLKNYSQALSLVQDTQQFIKNRYKDKLLYANVINQWEKLLAKKMKYQNP